MFIFAQFAILCSNLLFNFISTTHGEYEQVKFQSMFALHGTWTRHEEALKQNNDDILPEYVCDAKHLRKVNIVMQRNDIYLTV